MRIPTFPLLLLLAACSPPVGAAQPVAERPAAGQADAQQAGAQQGRHAESGLKIVPLTVTQDGRTHRFAVEVAESESEQEKGLMFRKAMGADEGMIFPMKPARIASFWMRNTLIPLDIIFVGQDGRVINISANAEPETLTPRQSLAIASAVLELNGGRAAELGIRPGALVEW